VWFRLLEPSGLIPLFGMAQGFVDHVPKVVLRDGATSLSARLRSY
jgi:hypothetical protein